MPFEEHRELQAKMGILKRQLDIHSVKRGNDKDRRRITVAVVWEYLRLGRDVGQAYFLESELYRALRQCHLSCDPLPEEKRLEELRKKQGSCSWGVRVNPLKLVSERRWAIEEQIDPLVEGIIKVLTREEVKNDGVSTDHSREGSHKDSRHIKKCPRPFKKKERISLYKPHSIRPSLL